MARASTPLLSHPWKQAMRFWPPTPLEEGSTTLTWGLRLCGRPLPHTARTREQRAHGSAGCRAAAPGQAPWLPAPSQGISVPGHLCARASLQARPCKDPSRQRCCTASFPLTWKSYLWAPAGNACQQIAQRFWQTRPIKSTVTSKHKKNRRSSCFPLRVCLLDFFCLQGLEGIKIPPFLCQTCITLLLDTRISE